MPYSLAISDLQSAPFNTRRIQQDKQVLNRGMGKFQLVVNGRCSLDFAENVALKIEWVAIGRSEKQSLDFSVKVRLGFEPHLEGAILVDDSGIALSWSEQNDFLATLVGSLHWQVAVKESLANSCLVGIEL